MYAANAPSRLPPAGVICISSPIIAAIAPTGMSRPAITDVTFDCPNRVYAYAPAIVASPEVKRMNFAAVAVSTSTS